MPFDKLDHFTVRPNGEETVKKKIDGSKFEIPYLSRDEYDDLKDPQLIGYATFNRDLSFIERNQYIEFYDKAYDIVGLLEYEDTLISTVRNNKSKFKAIKGYFDVGNNQYVAITKYSPLIFLIPLLLILLIIGLFASCGGLNSDPDPVDPWQPTIEENLGEHQENTTEQLTNVIHGFLAWHVAEGETENLPIILENPDGNSGYFSFVITLADSGEELYRSAMVKPGDTIRSININRPLEAGQYTALIDIFINDLENGNEMTPFQFQFKITVD